MDHTKQENLLIADDHDVVALGVEHIVEHAYPQRFNVERARNGHQALDKIIAKRYDLYILDLELPDMTGFELIEYVRSRYPEAKIIIHTMHDELWYHRKLDEYDVDGIVLKSSGAEQLVKAIRCVMEDGTYLCNEVEELERRKPVKVMRMGQNLSEREISVLQYIAKGLNTTEIAERLCISVNTVETHRRHLNEKLNAKNTASLIMNAVKCGALTVVDC